MFFVHKNMPQIFSWLGLVFWSHCQIGPAFAQNDFVGALKVTQPARTGKPQAGKDF
jgi:hypothetical protein